MKQLSYIFLFIVLLFACTNEIEPTLETIEKLELSLSEKIKLFLDKAHLKHLGIDEKSQQSLIDFYKNRNFDPKWINEESLNQEGLILNSLLANKLQFGLPEYAGGSVQARCSPGRWSRFESKPIGRLERSRSGGQERFPQVSFVRFDRDLLR